MNDDPYGWKPKYFESQRDYLRLLSTINGLALTAESQLDAMRDVDLCRVQDISELQKECEQLHQRRSDEYRRHLNTMDSLSKLLTQALNNLRAGRKKKALALVEQAAHTVNSQIVPF